MHIDLLFQSNIQENKDWNFTVVGDLFPAKQLSEQHPREQGLKQNGVTALSPKTPLSEQHPREQGLKRCRSKSSKALPGVFQSNIQENKDWNKDRSTNSYRCLQLLSEQHPREQGLKPHICLDTFQKWYLSEQHPREQGLKLCNKVLEWRNTWFTFRATSKRTRIETLFSVQRRSHIYTFRATSKRTRIETFRTKRFISIFCTFRATSKRTRIETIREHQCRHL